MTTTRDAQTAIDEIRAMLTMFKLNTEPLDALQQVLNDRDAQRALYENQLLRNVEIIYDKDHFEKELNRANAALDLANAQLDLQRTRAAQEVEAHRCTQQTLSNYKRISTVDAFDMTPLLRGRGWLPPEDVQKVWRHMNELGQAIQENDTPRIATTRGDIYQLLTLAPGDE